MGAYLCPCLCPENSYQPIADEDREESYNSRSIEITNGAPPLAQRVLTVPIPTYQAGAGTSSVPSTPSNADSANVFHMIPELDDGQFDRDSPVFKGMVVEQKFFNKSTYDPKFIWVNLKSRTLCLSEHNSRERSHKEASLADVTGVIAGPPERFKAPLGADGQPIKLNCDECMSIKFVRGGAIDVKFKSAADRDLWHKVMVRIIVQQKDLEKTSAPN